MGQGVTYAKASTVQVTVDMETKRSRPITDDERAFLLEFQEDGH
jgi:acyl-CoA thioesterase FadM